MLEEYMTVNLKHIKNVYEPKRKFSGPNVINYGLFCCDLRDPVLL
jgi:hypothetical protein